MKDETGNHEPHGVDAILCKLCGETFSNLEALAAHFKPGDVCKASHQFAPALRRNTKGHWELRA